MEEEIKMNYEYLEHHGILGQKWGVRRFQNKDGSYTSLGARRYAKAAEAAQRDADDLRKHGYTKEADAVQKVADKNRAKANKKQEELNKRLNSGEFTSKDVRISRKEAKKLNKDAKSRLSGDVNQNTIGIYQKNGDTLFVDRKIAEKYGPGIAEKKALEYIEKATRERKKLKKASDYAEEKALVDELLKDFNGDSEELAVLKDLERSYK